MEIRTFDTGANRDSSEGKMDFEGFLSPLVIERYAQYMNKNRTLKDGSVRDSDNWTHFFGGDHYGVCMSSGWRHFFSWWKAHRGYRTEEDIEESICALMFNAQAYLFKILKEKEERNKTHEPFQITK